MEGKKMETFIYPLAITWERLRDGEARKGQEETLRWTHFYLKGKLQETGEENKTLPYIENMNGSHNLTNYLGLKHHLMGFGCIWRRRKNCSSKFLVSKKYIFHGFWRHRNSSPDFVQKDWFTHIISKVGSRGLEWEWGKYESCRES